MLVPEQEERDNTIEDGGESGSDSDETPPVKRQRHEKAKREEAYKILAPRFSMFNSLDEVQWKDGETEVVSSVVTKDSKDILATVYGVSRGDSNRASNAIARLLQNPANRSVKVGVIQLIQDDKSMENNILKGIRSSISHHTQGSGPRTNVAETFVRNVCCAAAFNLSKIDKENDPIPRAPLTEILGITWQQADTALKTAKHLLEEKTGIAPLQRKNHVTLSAMICCHTCMISCSTMITQG